MVGSVKDETDTRTDRNGKHRVGVPIDPNATLNTLDTWMGTSSFVSRYLKEEGYISSFS